MSETEVKPKPKSYPVGEAPWDKQASVTTTAPKSYPVGQAPWEQPAQDTTTATGSSSPTSADFKTQNPTFMSAVNSVYASPQQQTQGVQDATNRIPAVTGAVGAAAGALAAGPAGEVAGSGVGTAVGSLAKDTINHFVFGEQKSLSDIGKDAAIEGGLGALAQGAGAAVTKVGGSILKWGAEKVVPKAVIERYQQAADAVSKLINSNNGDIAEASDQVKKGITSSLDDFREQMNNQITATLKESKETVSATPIIKQLEKYKATLNPKLHADQISQIDDLLYKTKDLAGMVDANAKKGAAGDLEDYISQMRSNRSAMSTLPEQAASEGKISAVDANELKKLLQDKATAAYRLAGESGGGTDLAEAAKQAGAVTRKLLNEAVPDVAEANQKLATLHYIEDRMNKNIIRSGKAESGLIAAGKYSPGGSEGSATNAKALRLLGQLTGKDFLGGAQDLAAMQAFGKDSLFKHGVGALAGGALGAGYSEISGGDPTHGAAVGATLGGVMTSPYAIKAGLDFAGQVPQVAMPAVRQTLGQAVMHGSGASDALKQVGGSP